MIQYKQSKIIHSLLTGAKKLPPVLKKLIVPLTNIHSHNTRKKNLVYWRASPQKQRIKGMEQPTKKHNATRNSHKIQK